MHHRRIASEQAEKVELADGTTILAEVTVTSAGGDATAFRRLKMADLRRDLCRIGQLVHDAVSGALADPPKRYGVEFGVKLVVETTGLATVLAKASGEATLVVRLEWEH
jgi:hypothetical protein